MAWILEELGERYGKEPLEILQVIKNSKNVDFGGIRKESVYSNDFVIMLDAHYGYQGEDKVHPSITLAEKEILLQQISALKDNLQKSEAARKVADSEYNNLKEQLFNVRAEEDRVKDRIIAQNNLEIARLNQEKDNNERSYELKIKHLEEEISRLKEFNSDLEHQAVANQDNLKARIEAEVELLGTQKKISSMCTQMNTLEQTNKTLAEQLDSAKLEIDNSNSNIEMIRKNISTTIAGVMTLAEQLKEISNIKVISASTEEIAPELSQPAQTSISSVQPAPSAPPAPSVPPAPQPIPETQEIISTPSPQENDQTNKIHYENLPEDPSGKSYNLPQSESFANASYTSGPVSFKMTTDDEPKKSFLSRIFK